MKLINLFESKASENVAINVLRKSNVESPEKIVEYFASHDKSQNQKNIPVMAYIYVGGYDDLQNIVNTVNEYNDLEIKKRVKPIQVAKGKLSIGDKTFDNFITFSEYIHGETNKYATKSDSGSVKRDEADVEAMDKPLWSGNGIDIYDGVDVGRCIKYTQGSLTGKRYSFCIGQPGNTMYQSYRDSQGSTFYYIIDKNHMKTNEDGSVNLNDPLHIVVFDQTNDGPLLTDANNNTGDIANYGRDAESYVQYLEDMGVPVDELLVNRPKTDQEKEEDRLLGRKNEDLQWFIKLPYEYKSKYIGRGHRLTDDQFDYLIS